MDSLPPPFAFVVLLFAGWVNRQQQAVIDYLLEENRVLRPRTDLDGSPSATTSAAAWP
jgi:hypothetical protein